MISAVHRSARCDDKKDLQRKSCDGSGSSTACSSSVIHILSNAPLYDNTVVYNDSLTPVQSGGDERRGIDVASIDVASNVKLSLDSHMKVLIDMLHVASSNDEDRSMRIPYISRHAYIVVSLGDKSHDNTMLSLMQIRRRRNTIWH